MAQIQLTNQLPNLNAPLAKGTIKINGKDQDIFVFLIPPWNSFLQQISKQAGSVIDTEADSPFEQTANANGKYILTGGTITDVRLTRGTFNFDITGEIIIPIRIGDTIRVEFSGNTLIRFLPD